MRPPSCPRPYLLQFTGKLGILLENSSRKGCIKTTHKKWFSMKSNDACHDPCRCVRYSQKMSQDFIHKTNKPNIIHKALLSQIIWKLLVLLLLYRNQTNIMSAIEVGKSDKSLIEAYLLFFLFRLRALFFYTLYLPFEKWTQGSVVGQLLKYSIPSIFGSESLGQKYTVYLLA